MNEYFAIIFKIEFENKKFQIRSLLLSDIFVFHTYQNLNIKD